MASISVIVNPTGGSFVEGQTEEAIRRAFSTESAQARMMVCGPGDDLGDLAREAVSDGAETIVACGGDGTVSVVARVVAEARKRLGILPLGTLNHFARDLGIPSDIDGAAAVIAGGKPQAVDLCRVNGRTFINNSSIGLYPRIVRKRDAIQERLGHGKWSAAFFAAIQVLKRHSLLSVRLNTDDLELKRTTPFVFVGNNAYQMNLYDIGTRGALDTGEMSVYFLHKSGRWGVVLLALNTLLGRLDQAEEFQELRTQALTIETRKKTLLVALDGEVFAMETPLKYEIMPRALDVLVPSKQGSDA